MDIKELRGLMEAYQQVNAPQEVDEAVKGESSERRKDLAAERRAGVKPLSAKEGEKYASHKLSQMAYAKRKRMGEELDIFDVVLEFLQVEGYAKTLEEAEWLMANELDSEDIANIIDEALTGERYKKALKKGKMYSRMHSADPEKRPTRGGRGGKQSDFGSPDRGTGNKAARRAGKSVYDSRYED